MNPQSVIGSPSPEQSKIANYGFGLWLMFAWFILAILPAAASDEGIPHALRSILMLPPAIFFAAFAGVWAYYKIRNNGLKKTATVIMLLFIVIVGTNAYVSYFITWAKNPNLYWAFNENYVEIGNQINALPASTQKYVVVVASRRSPRARHPDSRGNRNVRHRFFHDINADCEPHHLPLAQPDKHYPSGNTHQHDLLR